MKEIFIYPWYLHAKIYLYTHNKEKFIKEPYQLKLTFIFANELPERANEATLPSLGEWACTAAVLELNSANSGTGATFSVTELPIMWMKSDLGDITY